MINKKRIALHLFLFFFDYSNPTSIEIQYSLCFNNDAIHGKEKTYTKARNVHISYIRLYMLHSLRIALIHETKMVTFGKEGKSFTDAKTWQRVQNL